MKVKEAIAFSSTKSNVSDGVITSVNTKSPDLPLNVAEVNYCSSKIVYP